jgi:hypothetical protein
LVDNGFNQFVERAGQDTSNVYRTDVANPTSADPFKWSAPQTALGEPGGIVAHPRLIADEAFSNHGQ